MDLILEDLNDLNNNVDFRARANLNEQYILERLEWLEDIIECISEYDNYHNIQDRYPLYFIRQD